MSKENIQVFSNIRFVYSAVWKYARPLLIILLPASHIVAVSKYITSFMLKLIIDSLTNDRQLKGFIFQLFFYFLVVTILSLCRAFFNSFSYLSSKVRYKMIIEKNAKVMSIPYEMLEDSELLDIYQRATSATLNDSFGIEGFINSGFSLFGTFVSTIVGLVFVGEINVYVVMIIFLVVLFEFFIMNKLNADCKTKLWNPLAPVIRKSEYLDNVSTDFSYAKEIRIFSLSDWLMGKYRRLSEQKLNVAKKNAKTWNRYTLFSNGLWGVTQIFTYGWLLYLILKKYISIGEFTFFLSAIAIFFHNLSDLFSQVADFLQKSREVNDFRLFMSIKSDKDENKIDVPNYTCWKFEFKDVSFKYPMSDSYALKNINLVIEDKEHLALVGLNGSGKSTFIKLLLGLFEPTCGEILLNGHNIHNFKKESYYRAFAPVFQETNIFALPVWQNITLKSEDESNFLNVELSLKVSGLEEKIKTFPNESEQDLLRIISNDGVNLSGGERQKLAIARAVYKDSPCFVFDEVDSALDVFSEKRFYEKLSDLIKNKTTVLISHKLSSVNICDKIAFFENGHIAEYGTKEELLKKDSIFSYMWKEQSLHYKTNTEAF